MSIKLGIRVGSGGAGGLLVIALTVGGVPVTYNGQPILVSSTDAIYVDENGAPIVDENGYIITE